MSEQKKLIPAIFTDGDMKRLKVVLQTMGRNTPCGINSDYCKDVSPEDCGDRLCILSMHKKAFKEDPIQWLLDKKFITKGQALDLTLLI